jgi:hypothetical protein
MEEGVSAVPDSSNPDFLLLDGSGRAVLAI